MAELEIVQQLAGSGLAFMILGAWLAWALREVRRLQKLCNRRTEDYLDLIIEMSDVKLPRRRNDEDEEGLTNRGI